MGDAGYTQVQNWMLAKLYRADGLTFREVRILLYLIRKIHGFHKDADKISYGQIAEATGIDERDVKRAMKALEDQEIISVRRKKNYVNIIKIRGGQITHPGGGQKGSKRGGQITHSQNKDQKSDLVGSPLSEESNNKEKKSYAELVKEMTDDEYE